MLPRLILYLLVGKELIQAAKVVPLVEAQEESQRQFAKTAIAPGF